MDYSDPSRAYRCRREWDITKLRGAQAGWWISMRHSKRIVVGVCGRIYSPGHVSLRDMLSEEWEHVHVRWACYCGKRTRDGDARRVNAYYYDASEAHSPRHPLLRIAGQCPTHLRNLLHCFYYVSIPLLCYYILFPLTYHPTMMTAHVGRIFIKYKRRIRAVVRIDSPLAALNLFPLIRFYNFASVLYVP